MATGDTSAVFGAGLEGDTRRLQALGCAGRMGTAHPKSGGCRWRIHLLGYLVLLVFMLWLQALSEGRLAVFVQLPISLL